MKIYSILDDEFTQYGKVVEGNFTDILNILSETPCPNQGTVYKRSDARLEKTDIKAEWQNECFGGMPIQVGYCNGHNSILNALEYHKGNEINVAADDVVLLLGDVRDIKNGIYDTALVKAFLLPKGKAVEIYSTTLHYAPCGVSGAGFRVIIVLPERTNAPKSVVTKCPMLWGSNKWLLAHRDSPEAQRGAYVGLVGENLQV